MYQFTSTRILNKLTDANDIEVIAGAADLLTIQNLGRFTADEVVSVYKRVGTAAVNEITTFDMPTTAAGNVVRVTVTSKIDQTSKLSTFADTLDTFSKPLTIEILSQGDETLDGPEFVKQVNKIKSQYGVLPFTAEVDGIDAGIVYLTAVDGSISLKTIVEVETDGDYIAVEVSAVGTAGKTAFGDSQWMLSNVKMITPENFMPHGVAGELPNLGAFYDQYTIKVKVLKDSTPGIVMPGYSVTEHIFWVNSTISAAVTTAINLVEAGLVDAI